MYSRWLVCSLCLSGHDVTRYPPETPEVLPEFSSNPWMNVWREFWQRKRSIVGVFCLFPSRFEDHWANTINVFLRQRKRTRCHLLRWSHSCLKKHGGADGIWLDEEQMLVCCLALCKHLSLLVCSPLPNEGAFDVSEKQIILFVGFSLDNYPRNVLTIATWNNNKVSTHNFFLSLLMPGKGEKKNGSQAIIKQRACLLTVW